MSLAAVSEAAAAAAVVSSSSPLPIHKIQVTTMTAVAPPLLDPEERRCRACSSTKPLFTDWAQGDLICTECGVVNEEHLLDFTAEWKEFNDADDLAKGGPALARCGLVMTDETKYIGGLQPTKLSKQCFGGGNDSVKLSVRTRLIAANRKMDRRMEQLHVQAVNNAKLSLRYQRQVQKRKLQSPQDADETDAETINPFADDDDETQHSPIGLEHLILKEEEDANRIRTALYADKWSLQRAVRLCKNNNNNSADAEGLTHEVEVNDEAEEGMGEKKLDATLQRASRDLYCAYTILLAAAKRLELPDRVTQEATHMLCRYATRRDGLHVRGVASTLREKKNTPDDVTKKQSINQRRNQNAAVERAAKEALSDYNKAKQMGALCAALLFCTARNMQWPRSLVEVCDSVKAADVTTGVNGTINPHLLAISSNKDSSFIKKKHCSKALTEIKETFPDFAKSAASGDVGVTRNTTNWNKGDDPSTSPAALGHFIEHTLRKLTLPPVAAASIHCLVVHMCRQLRQLDGETSEGATGPRKLALVCAAVAYFVCSVGSTMQRLALQSRKRLESNSKAVKRRRVESQSVDDVKKQQPTDDVKESKDESGDNLNSLRDANNQEDLLDVSLDGWSDFAAEQRAYEMSRMWDAWSEQRPWDRTLALVESCCGVTQKLLVEFYQKHLYPNRQDILVVLKNAVSSTTNQTLTQIPVEQEEVSRLLRGTPMASILLSQVTAAAPLLKMANRK